MNDVDLTASDAWTAGDARRLAAGWLEAFETALASRDPALIAALFVPDSHWRDLLAFTWDITLDAGCLGGRRAYRGAPTGDRGA